MSEIVAEWGGRIFFDGAHQAGLIAGGQFQDPLREGAAVLTGSAGKTFSGPQSGIIVWNDPALTKPITHAIFPVLAATHQVNRVAALAVSAAEMLAFGEVYMAQIVRNARALAAALDSRSVPILGKPRGYTTTHQVIADVSRFGGGGELAQRLARRLPWQIRTIGSTNEACASCASFSRSCLKNSWILSEPFMNRESSRGR
jgi:glycine hydroxymethyltransferase